MENKYSFIQFWHEVGNCHKPLFHLTCDDSDSNYYNWLRKLHSKGTEPKQTARILERAYSMFIESSKFLFI